MATLNEYLEYKYFRDSSDGTLYRVKGGREPEQVSPGSSMRRYINAGMIPVESVQSIAEIPGYKDPNAPKEPARTPIDIAGVHYSDISQVPEEVWANNPSAAALRGIALQPYVPKFDYTEDYQNNFGGGSTGGGSTTQRVELRKVPEVNYEYNSLKETASQYNARILREQKARDEAIAYNQEVQTSSSNRTGGVSTGNPELDALYSSLEEYLTRLEKNGQVLNPNIKLDASTLAKFTKQAEAEIDPYYKGQLKMARESLLNSAGFSRDEVLRTEQDLERQYQQNFRQLSESAADRGFALSGIRNREETDLATDTQNTINKNRRNLDFDLGNSARQFAQAYGSSELPQLNIGDAPTVGAGETGFGRPQGTRSLYQLDPNVYAGLVGSQEFERRGAVKNRASQLEDAFRSNLGVQQQRALTL